MGRTEGGRLGGGGREGGRKDWKIGGSEMERKTKVGGEE